MEEALRACKRRREEARKRTRRSDLVMPDDVIREMLSWLPVKSLLRFKCVCKSWQLIIQHTSFIEKHMIRSPFQIVDEEIYRLKGIFMWKCYTDGLVLEQNPILDKYHIRNPATKQVIEVPEYPLKVKSEWRSITMVSNYKLICVHHTIDTQLKPCFVFKTLTVGTDLDWRHVGTLWYEFDLDSTMVGATTYNEITYITILGSHKTNIVRLNMDDQDESFMTINIPHGFAGPVYGQRIFTIAQWFQNFMWDEKLLLGYLIEDELHVWVLENYKKQQWSEKKIIPLHFIKDYPNVSHRTYVLTASKGQLEVSIANVWVQYDIHSNKVTCLAETLPGKEVFYQLKPSLVSLKGMHSEVHSEDMPTHNKHDKDGMEHWLSFM